MNFITTLIILGLSISSYGKDCGKLGAELINLSFEMHQEFEKTKSADAVMKKYNEQLNKKIDDLGKFGDAHPECRKELEAAASEAAHQLQDIQKQAKKTSTDIVSYEEWFTLQSTGIKSGKKYSFIACVNGQRNLTSIQCHVPGSAAKRVFYNTDDIKDLEIKRKWVNTINQNMCVTAYVTGHEAFIVDLKNQNECK